MKVIQRQNWYGETGVWKRSALNVSNAKHLWTRCQSTRRDNDLDRKLNSEMSYMKVQNAYGWVFVVAKRTLLASSFCERMKHRNKERLKNKRREGGAFVKRSRSDGWCICEEKPLRRDPRWFPINSSVYCEAYCSGTINQSSVLQVPNLNAEQQDSYHGAKSENCLPKYVDTPLRLPYLCHLSLQTTPVLLATMTYDDWLTDVQNKGHKNTLGYHYSQ